MWKHYIMRNTNKHFSDSTEAYLEIILGPMFSGKTSYLVNVYNQCKFCNIPVVVINHSFDNRYDNTLMSTHDKIMVPCVKAEKLWDLWKENDDVNVCKVLLINEGQLFPDLFDFVTYMMKNCKKTIYVGGLDGDFQRQKFGQILDLIPLCDNVQKLSSMCSLCKNGKAGIFSHRISCEKEQIVIGSDNYIPVCRKCYEMEEEKGKKREEEKRMAEAKKYKEAQNI